MFCYSLSHVQITDLEKNNTFFLKLEFTSTHFLNFVFPVPYIFCSHAIITILSEYFITNLRISSSAHSTLDQVVLVPTDTSLT